MIKKASSSEIFDIYAKRMISKRAGAAGTLVQELRDVLPFTRNIAGEIAETAVNTARSSIGDAKLGEGLLEISKASPEAAGKELKALFGAAHITEGKDLIMRSAGRAGYTNADVFEFLREYSSNFKQMSQDYKALVASGKTPSDAEIIKFVRDHEKPLKFFNEIKSNTRLSAIFEEDFAKAGEKALKAGETDISLDRAKALSGDAPRVPKTPEELQAEREASERTSATDNFKAETDRIRANTEAAKSQAQIAKDVAETDMKGKATALGVAAGIGGMALKATVFAGAMYGAWSFFSKISDKVNSVAATSEEHFQKAEAAIGCIDAIDLKPGSPAVKQREIIKENLKAFSAMQTVPTITDQAEREKIWSEVHRAAGELIGTGNGSLAGFVSLISEHPMDNLEGFFLGNKYTSTAAGGAGGAAIGAAAGYKMSHTLIGAAIGGVLGGLAGYNWLGKWYDDELTCLLAAGDAIKYVDEKLAEELGTPEERASAGTGSNDQPGATRGGSGSSPIAATGDTSFLAKVLSVGATQKLIGIPGIEFTNEKKLTESYIAAAGGAENAATILIQKNPNIASWIESIRKNDPAVLSAPIDSKFSNNKSAKGLLESVYLTMQATFKNAVRGKRKLGIFTPSEEELIGLIRAQLAREGTTITTSAKNNSNKMNKTSKSINNQELIRKAAETRVSYFGDANLGLKEQLTKSYYAGLTDMYNEKPQKRSSDYKDLYGFQEETGEDLVLQSHPKSITLADAMGKGGLVENGLEAKEKSTYVALNTPSGNFQSKYASTIGYLNKLAKAADAQGKKEVSKLIKQTIQNLK